MPIEALAPETVNVEAIAGASSVRDIAETLVGRPDVVFTIDLNESYAPNAPGKYQGIELLKWMRILGITNHCVLRSEDNFHQLRRIHPSYEVVSEKGNTLIVGGVKEFGELSELAALGEMREYFRRHIDLLLEKHIAANRFGLERVQQLHLNNDRTFQPSRSSRVPDLQYEAMKFAYDVAPLTTLNNLGEAPALLKDLRRECSDKKPIVVLVDDMADEGWAELFHHILGNGCVFHAIGRPEIEKNSSPAKLAALIKSKGINVKTPHLLILDLRLLDEEETSSLDGKPVDDYKDFLSFQTFKALNLRKEGDMRLKVMLSTASRDQSKLKGLRESRVFSPHGIFTKEGIEARLSAKASLENYCDLLRMLRQIIAKKSADSLIDSNELVHSDIETERTRLAEELSAAWNSWTQGPESTAVNWAQDVYVDTNIFLDVDDPTSLVCLLRNSFRRIRVPRTVLYELQVIAKDGQAEYGSNDVVAAFFVKKIKETNFTISDDGVDNKHKQIISNGLHHTSDFADRQIEALMLKPGGQKLLVSRDDKLLKKISTRSNGLAKTFFGIPHFTPSKKRSGSKAKGFTFTVEKISRSKSGKSFSFYSANEKAPVMSLSKSSFPTGITSTDLQKLVGTQVNSTNGATEIMNILKKLGE